jgi:hypothetical protein
VLAVAEVSRQHATVYRYGVFHAKPPLKLFRGGK